LVLVVATFGLVGAVSVAGGATSLVLTPNPSDRVGAAFDGVSTALVALVAVLFATADSSAEQA
jgi:multisubunit Na+/H+ antiporter MnhF subunit